MSRVQIGVLLGLFLSLACQGQELPVKRNFMEAKSTDDRHTQPLNRQSLREVQPAPQPLPGRFNSAATAGGPGFDVFRCEFQVPRVPAYKGQSIFIWCGVQQDSGITNQGDKSFGVLQPVLMLGPDCVTRGTGIGPDEDPAYEQNPYWYYSAQYVYPLPVGSNDYKCTTGTIHRASPGDVLVSVLTYDPKSDSMTVKVSKSTGADMSTLTVANPWDDQTHKWSEFIGKDQIVLEGSLETVCLDSPELLPPELFQGWYLKSTVKPLPGHPFTDSRQWKLTPTPGNRLSIRCTHQPVNLESQCTWKG